MSSLYRSLQRWISRNLFYQYHCVQWYLVVRTVYKIRKTSQGYLLRLRTYNITHSKCALQWWIIPLDIVVTPIISVTRSFDVFFDLRLNKRLSKQPWGWWFETPAWSLWRHRNDGFRKANKLSLCVTSKSSHYNRVFRYGRVNTSKIFAYKSDVLTHWDPVTHIRVNKLTRIGSEHGLSLDPGQGIIWTNDGHC